MGYYLQITAPTETSFQAQNEVAMAQPADLSQLIAEFLEVFVEPVNLPPTWHHNHEIPLKAD